MVLYFDSFGIEYTPQEAFNKIKDKSITHNIIRIQDHDSIMCGFIASRKIFIRFYQFIFF